MTRAPRNNPLAREEHASWSAYIYEVERGSGTRASIRAIEGRALRLEKEPLMPDPPTARQPAGGHDRRHTCRLQGGHAPRLFATRRAFAALSAGRDTRQQKPASLPTAADAERHAAASINVRLACVFLHSSSPARIWRGGSRLRTRADTRAQRRGGDPPAAPRNSAEVQRCRTAYGAGLRASEVRAQVGISIRAHAVAVEPARAARPPCKCVATAAQTAARLWRGAGVACCCGRCLFPGRNPVERVGRHSVVPSRRAQARDQRSASRHKRCGTASHAFALTNSIFAYQTLLEAETYCHHTDRGRITIRFIPGAANRAHAAICYVVLTGRIRARRVGPCIPVDDARIRAHHSLCRAAAVA